MKIATTPFFDKIIDAFSNSLPFVAYRHPQEAILKGFFQKNANLHVSRNYTESGFIFAPFDDKKSSVLFPLTESEIYTTTFTDVSFTDADKNEELQSYSKTAKDNHLALVQKGIDFLKTTAAEKVVLSRKEVLEFLDFDAVETFKKLLVNYSNAMVYVWFHPKVGLWLGATPETLLKVEENTFITMALAGTKPYKDTLNVIWNQKEKQEQQFVTDYIVKKLDECVFKQVISSAVERRELIISNTKTVKAGSLLHLQTDISGELSQEFTLSTLIKSLHPTPAVCGLPKIEAKTFILENENYNRTFYTGFLGELNLNSKTNLFVNLRCMQLLNSELAIYVGGGITLGSNPEKEWEETIEKSKIIKNVLVN